MRFSEFVRRTNTNSHTQGSEINRLNAYHLHFSPISPKTLDFCSVEEHHVESQLNSTTFQVLRRLTNTHTTAFQQPCFLSLHESRRSKKMSYVSPQYKIAPLRPRRGLMPNRHVSGHFPKVSCIVNKIESWPQTAFWKSPLYNEQNREFGLAARVPRKSSGHGAQPPRKSSGHGAQKMPQAYGFLEKQVWTNQWERA